MAASGEPAGRFSGSDFGQRIGDEKFSVGFVAGKIFKRQIQPGFSIEPMQNLFIANKKIFRVVAPGFGGDGLERDFRADAGDVAEGNADPVFHVTSASDG